MSDQIVRRGFAPTDSIEFGEKWKKRLVDGANDFRYLLDRNYNASSALELVGNRYQFSSRQRMALMRSICSPTSTALRKAKELSLLSGDIIIDGFNTIVTLEVALSGSIIISGDDGCLRDLAGLHGSYRIVDKTPIAIKLMLEMLQSTIDQVISIRILLDKPVSNSGRLKKLIEDLAREEGLEQLYVETLDGVDGVLRTQASIITSDSAILDDCSGWFNLNRRIVQEKLAKVWLYSF